MIFTGTKQSHIWPYNGILYMGQKNRQIDVDSADMVSTYRIENLKCNKDWKKCSSLLREKNKWILKLFILELLETDKH